MDIKSSKSEIRKEIADLINRIKEQSDRIGMQREIPQMELDLILHRIEELHRRTVVWSYLNELPELVSGSEFKVPGSETVTVPSALGSARSDKSTPTAEIQQEEKVLKNDIQAEKFEAPTNPEPVVKNPEPPIVTKLSDRAEPRADKPTRNAESETRNLKDVRSFIGFNEKLMYIRQVFGGNNAAYDEALNKINEMKAFTEAETYMTVLGNEYKWNYQSEPVMIFIKTVKRRFT